MSGITIGWDNAAPANTDLVGQGDDQIRSLKSNVQGGLDAEHLWPSGGGLAGVHRAGSARVFVGPNSAISSADTTGRLMWDSTNSNLNYVGAEGTGFIGGRTVPSFAGAPTMLALSQTSRFLSWYTCITGNSWPTGPLTTPFQAGSSPMYWVTMSTQSSSLQSVMLGTTNRVPHAVVLANGAGTSPQIFVFTSTGSLSNETWTANIIGFGFNAL